MHSQNENGWTPLHSASWYGRFDIAGLLLDHGATSNSKDDFSRTPLHLVAGGIYNVEQDRVRVVHLLLERGADVNARDEGDATPLNWASFGGKIAIVRVLLDHGAAVDSKGYQDRTPLHSVAEGRCLYPDSEGDGIGIAQLLMEHGADISNWALKFSRFRSFSQFFAVFSVSGNWKPGNLETYLPIENALH